MTAATVELVNPDSELSNLMPKTQANRTPAAAAPAGVDRLVLAGFMGSGKTTIGALVAEHLGWKFLDLDHEIERREGRTVPQIFAESGEAEFRRLESGALASLLGRRRVVIALGGGAPEELGNRLLLEQTPHTAVVYLAAPFDVLIDRCLRQPNATERPVLADGSAAARRFEARQRHYARIASHTVETTALDPDATVLAVLAVLSS
ncbi:MAG: shikimate kinase [Acidobacteriota bacterium]